MYNIGEGLKSISRAVGGVGLAAVGAWLLVADVGGWWLTLLIILGASTVAVFERD